MAALLPGFAPSEDLTWILQVAAATTLIGLAVTLRRRGRDPSTDTWIYTTRWTLLGALLGVLFTLAEWLVS